MQKSKKFSLPALAAILGASSIIVPSSQAVSADDLIQMCYRSVTITIPFYLRNRYLAKGAVDDPCPASLP